MIVCVSDWQRFLQEVTWFLPPGASASVGDGERWSRDTVPALPRLSRLLEAATVTPVQVEGERYEMLAWGPPHRRRGWLCLPPATAPDEGIHDVHKSFLLICGGIIERFGEPASWWNNQNEVLTESAAGSALRPIFDDYSWLWCDKGLRLPIDPDGLYVVAVEANGNLTIADRLNGQLMLFAPDHAFTGVTPLPGCPPYSLMTIDGISDLTAWVEVNASSWATE